MQFTAYQILTPLVSFVAIAYAWNLVLRQRKTIWEATLWTIFWGVIGAIAIFPDFIDFFTAVTGIERRENAVMVTFIGVFAFIIFYLIMRLEEMEQRQTRMIRKLALRDVSSKPRKGEEK